MKPIHTKMDFELVLTFKPIDPVTVTDLVEPIFEGFAEGASDSDAMVRILDTGLLEITYVVEASDVFDATEQGRSVFVAGMSKSGISHVEEVLQPLDFNVHPAALSDKYTTVLPAYALA